MSEQQKHTFEERVRFVAKYYQENIFDAEQAWRRFAEKRNLRHFPRWIWQAAAVVLLALGGFAYFMIETQRPDWVAVATGVGELKEVLLPDSSTVSLAGGTELKYDARSFGGSERRVKLSGKAFFQVKHLEEKPFRVEIRESDVTVLGTSFLVRELPQELNVEVLTGRVRFKTGEGLSVIVEAGQAANYVEGAAAIQVDGGADGIAGHFHPEHAADDAAAPLLVQLISFLQALRLDVILNVHHNFGFPLCRRLYRACAEGGVACSSFVLGYLNHNSRS